MTIFFAFIVFIGIIWLILELAGKYNSPAPSMVGYSGNGWLLIIVGVIGILCTRYAP